MGPESPGAWLFFFPIDSTQNPDPGLLLIRGRTQYTSDLYL